MHWAVIADSTKEIYELPVLMHFWKFHFLTQTGSEWQWLIPLTVGHVRCIEAGEWSGEEPKFGAWSSGIAKGIQRKGWECNRAEGWRGAVGNRALGQPLSLWQRPSWGTRGQSAHPGQALHVLLAAEMGFALVSKHVQAKQNKPASQL